MDIDDMELDDLGIPIPTVDSDGCSDCNAHLEHSPIDDTFQIFHYDNCFFMNPDNFLVGAA